MVAPGVMQRCCSMSCIDRSALLPSAKAPDRSLFGENMHAAHYLVCSCERNPSAASGFIWIASCVSPRVLPASGRPLSPKRTRFLCQGIDSVAPNHRGGTAPRNKNFTYGCQRLVGPKGIQLLLRRNLSQHAANFSRAATEIDFAGTNRSACVRPRTHSQREVCL